MNKYSAAQVANWVYQTFPPDGTNWDYYNWLEAKGNELVRKRVTATGDAPA